MSGNSAFSVTGSASGTGTVTSVAMVSSDGLLAITGSPITNSGTFGVTVNTLPVSVGATGITTYNQGDMIYASSANTLSALAKNTNATRYLSNTGTNNDPAWAQIALATGVSGFLPIGNIVSTAGSPSTQYLRGDGTWDVPPGGGGTVTSVSATAPLASTGGATPVITLADVVPLNLGGTNADLSGTVSNGGIVYSTATTLAILAGTTTANQPLLSGLSTAPSWATATYLPTLAANEIVYASSANTMAQIATAMNSVLATNGSSQPAMTQLLPSAVQLQVGSFNGGTSASSSTFWRGDGSWAAPSGGGSGGLLNIQYLTTGVGATYTPTAGTMNILVQMVGGGGGSGGGAGSTITFNAAGGGGGGAFCQKYITAIASSYTYTIGAGGAAGSAGNNNGSAGSATTFNSGALSAGGGGGGEGSAGKNGNNFDGLGGAGGVASGGDLNVPGGAGGVGIILTTSAAGAGSGGSTQFGQAPGANFTLPSGVASGIAGTPNTGCGASGASSNAYPGNVAGAQGGSGLIIVYEYS